MPEILILCQRPQRSFPGGSGIKNPPANTGDVGSIPEWRRSPREGNSSPLQYSCLENPTDRGTWRATVHGVCKRQTRLNNNNKRPQRLYAFLIIIFEFLLIYWLRLTACGILVPRPGIKSVAPGVEALSLSHWSTREVPESRALKQLILCYVVFTSI